MKPYLMRLSCGRYSLEFKDQDRRALIAAIRDRFGSPDIEVVPGESICRFGGAVFTFHDQWDEPCLISSSPLGDDILQRLVDDLDAASPPPRGGSVETERSLGI